MMTFTEFYEKEKTTQITITSFHQDVANVFSRWVDEHLTPAIIPQPYKQEESPLTKPVFDWSTARVGMAFKNIDSGAVFYLLSSSVVDYMKSDSALFTADANCYNAIEIHAIVFKKEKMQRFELFDMRFL